MIKKEIIAICEQAICKEFGSLDDLPRELANTVVNIFYKYHSSLSEKSHRVDNSNSIQQFSNKAQNIGTEPVSWFMDQQDIHLDYDLVPDLIKGIRICDKRDQPDIYKRMVDFSLFILKYHIKDALNKSYLRLRIERYFVRNKVQEIPNLIDLMKLGTVKKKAKRSRKKRKKKLEYNIAPKKVKSPKTVIPPSKNK